VETVSEGGGDEEVVGGGLASWVAGGGDAVEAIVLLFGAVGWKSRRVERGGED
jgi:hypothetical protein